MDHKEVGRTLHQYLLEVSERGFLIVIESFH